MGQDAGSAFLSESRETLSGQLLPRIRLCLDALTDAQVWWRPNEASNAIGNLLLHLSGNVRQWIVGGVGGAPDTRVRQEEFDERRAIPKAELFAKLSGTVAEACAVLDAFDPERLLVRLRIQGNDVTALSAIAHVVEHFSMHTGQIILLTKMQTAADLRFYSVGPDGVAKAAWIRK